MFKPPKLEFPLVPGVEEPVEVVLEEPVEVVLEEGSCRAGIVSGSMVLFRKSEKAAASTCMTMSASGALEFGLTKL